MAATQNSDLGAVYVLRLGLQKQIFADRVTQQDRYKMDVNRYVPSVIKFKFYLPLKHLIASQIILLFKTASRSFSPEVGQVYLTVFLCCTLE